MQLPRRGYSPCDRPAVREEQQWEQVRVAPTHTVPAGAAMYACMICYVMCVYCYV